MGRGGLATSAYDDRFGGLVQGSWSEVQTSYHDNNRRAVFGPAPRARQSPHTPSMIVPMSQSRPDTSTSTNTGTGSKRRQKGGREKKPRYARGRTVTLPHGSGVATPDGIRGYVELFDDDARAMLHMAAAPDYSSPDVPHDAHGGHFDEADYALLDTYRRFENVAGVAPQNHAIINANQFCDGRSSGNGGGGGYQPSTGAFPARRRSAPMYPSHAHPGDEEMVPLGPTLQYVPSNPPILMTSRFQPTHLDDVTLPTHPS
jgi:hypothetical protein